MEQYQVDCLKARLKMIKYLLSKADKRGVTHGEKHHFIQVAAFMIDECLYDTGDTYTSTLHLSTMTPKDVAAQDTLF